MADGWLKLAGGEGGGVLLQAGGHWDARNVTHLDRQLRGLGPMDAAQPKSDLTLDLGQVERLDTAGAWLLYRTLKEFRDSGARAEYAGLSPAHAAMLEVVAANDQPCEIEPPRSWALITILDHLGRGVLDVAEEAKQQIAFLGLILATLAGTLRHPGRLRLVPLVYHMEKVGLNALPIVGLISFLIGVVLAYQGATQLQRFGAEIFVVNLIAVSVLREIAILLTAIVVAGRSGSAFTAEIGSMVVNEEVDAMRTLGLDPIEVLVLPRVLALVITLPLLAFFADMMGLFGGMLMCWGALDISPGLFLERLQGAISPWSFWVGMIKAPVFAFLIAMVGCLEGLRVTRSAESVGQQTTRSVVTGIFLVIVFDAVFSIFFATVGV
ncbi:MAG: MlaE family lipid ABC transporter permease subunit [Rhodospirillaceae bacterium]|nr:MlaE family lipid ABC transporter permease subunit [Rhodospirillaceae bacterium]MBT5895256.1 MlaE family lipid ABC transporter permease subunit [Rhodospirillaceae bacterium]MBT6431001.1 MlaE family lipid ABC transporter permease subunit [Rhodospirillaceae bacterium]MBT7758423.1 MlaE family lipid ABC transporter permease subunit [Rhodospirillaceae bacterium]